jgi:hypothetical protein
MGAQGVVLLWRYHPRWAFAVSLLFCLFAAAAFIDLIRRRDWFGVVGMGLVLLMFGSLLFVLTRWAVRRSWRPFTAEDAREAIYKAQGLIPPS